MRPFFQNASKQRQLLIEAERWLGTPFMPFQGVRGGGCDCIHLVNELIISCGFPHDFKPPAYTLDATAHRDDSILHDYLDRMPGCQQIDLNEKRMLGDFMTFVMGRAPHHLGMMVKPPFFIHVIRGLTVSYAQLDDPTWGKRLNRAYRLYEQ